MEQMIHITIPWDALVSDNRRMIPVVQKGKLRMVPSKEYADAKQRIREIALTAVNVSRPRDRISYEPYFPEGEVVVAADFWLPDLRKRDHHNFTKQVLDSLTGVVYTDDYQVRRGAWERCGIDRDNPRLELTIKAI